MLEVGKTYHHSRNGKRDAWKIVDQWSDDIYEGIHHTLNNDDRRCAVLFNKNGTPIGGKGRRSYEPDFHLVEPSNYEYIILYGDDSISKVWYKVKPLTHIYVGATYIVREAGKNDTCRVLLSDEMKSFIREL